MPIGLEVARHGTNRRVLFLRATLCPGLLWTALLSSGALRTLLLWGNPIGDDGVLALAAALKPNDTLRKLHL
jgi:hypothetical protein